MTGKCFGITRRLMLVSVVGALVLASSCLACGIMARGLELDEARYRVTEVARGCERFREKYGQYPWPRAGGPWSLVKIDPVAVTDELWGSVDAKINRDRRVFCGDPCAVKPFHFRASSLPRGTTAFVDPWGQPILFRVDPTNGAAVVWSCGPNGKDDTNDGVSPDPVKQPKSYFLWGKGGYADDIVRRCPPPSAPGSSGAPGP